MNKPPFKVGDSVVFSGVPKKRDYEYSMCFTDDYAPTGAVSHVIKRILPYGKVPNNTLGQYYFCDCFKLDETQLFHDSLERLVNE